MRRTTDMANPISLRASTFTSPERVSLDNPGDVIGEVKNIILLIHKNFDFKRFDKVFSDVVELFRGNYPGYRRCNTFYHDLTHTMDCLLVTAKLIHGASLNGIVFTPRDVSLGLISALLHDTGYIQAREDNTGTGAKYTMSHIERSIEFLKKYFC